MTLPAANLRLADSALTQGTESADAHLSPQSQETRFDLARQDHVRAGVGAHDGGDRAGLAKVHRPGLSLRPGLQQAAFLTRPPAVIISEEIRAIEAKRRFHGENYNGD